jgi:hypothetical protein
MSNELQNRIAQLETALQAAYDAHERDLHDLYETACDIGKAIRLTRIGADFPASELDAINDAAKVNGDLIERKQTALKDTMAISKRDQPQPASLPAFKPGDRVSISDTSKIRAFRGDVGTITGYFKVTYHVHWDETPDDMTSAIDETDLKGE